MSSLFSCLIFFSFVSLSLCLFSLSSFSISVSVWCCGRVVVVGCGVCGVWCVSTQHVPVCTSKTSTVYASTTRTCWHVCAWCWVHLLTPIFCLLKFADIWVITCFRGSQKKPLDLTYFENGTKTTHSMYCPTRTLNHWTLRSRPVQYTHHTKQQRPKTRTTTTCRQQHTTPHSIQPPNQQRAAHDMTKHHTTKKHRHTRACTCTCTRTCTSARTSKHTCVYVHVFVCVCVCACVYAYVLSVFIFLKKDIVWNTHLPWCVLFQTFDLPQWLKVPFPISKCGRDKPRAQNCKNKK